MQFMLSAWKRLRANYWLSLGFDLAILLLVMWSIHAWQIRDLPLGEPAPSTVLAQMNSRESGNILQTGKTGVVYFFAPWCGHCRNSIGNLDDLVSSGSVDWASVVALDYDNANEIAGFVESTGIDLPTFLGTNRTRADWEIQAYPTYFVIDSFGNIHSRSVGYSTSLGIRARIWLARRSTWK